MADYQKRHTSLLYASEAGQRVDGSLKGGAFCAGGQRFENPELGRQLAMGNASAAEYISGVGLHKAQHDEPCDNTSQSPSGLLQEPTLFPQLLGTPEWYDARHNDHLERHSGAPMPPDYYLSYGKKYCVSFSTELYPKLSNEGQTWLVQARTNLQVAIGLELVKDPVAFDTLECDNAAFTAFAYKTHPEAYLNGGLASLPIADLMHIIAAPDISDLLTVNGLAQISSTLPSVLLTEGLEFFTEAGAFFDLDGTSEWLFGDDSELKVPGELTPDAPQQDEGSFWDLF